MSSVSVPARSTEWARKSGSLMSRLRGMDGCGEGGDGFVMADPHFIGGFPPPPIKQPEAVAIITGWNGGPVGSCPRQVRRKMRKTGESGTVALPAGGTAQGEPGVHG